MTNSDHQPRLFPGSSAQPVDGSVRVVWVFQRESAELRVAHLEDERLLVVARPDAPVQQRRFTTVDALIDYQAELETRLRREGWTLHHVEPDRRVRPDRRGKPRTGADRRHS
jgi:hypothetical protein